MRSDCSRVCQFWNSTVSFSKRTPLSEVSGWATAPPAVTFSANHSLKLPIIWWYWKTSSKFGQQIAGYWELADKFMATGKRDILNYLR